MCAGDHRRRDLDLAQRGPAHQRRAAQHIARTTLEVFQHGVWMACGHGSRIVSGVDGRQHPAPHPARGRALDVALASGSPTRPGRRLYRGRMRITSGHRFGNYVVEHLLGEGGMAEVWSVRHLLLDAHYALKVLTHSDPHHADRLLAEGRAQARLRHPNIVPVQDILTVGDAMGLVMPRIQGPSLDNLLERYRPTHAESVALIRAITSGLAHAHDQGLVHRDLKPANILLDAHDGHWVPRIADFGLVKHTAAPGQTRTGVMMGTLNYAAPEQIRDAAAVDHRADLFSLGVIVVELLSGTRPFQGNTVGETLDAYAKGPDLSGVPAGWRPLCTALLAFSASARLSSCAALVTQLDTLYPDDAQTPVAVHIAVADAPLGDTTATATATATGVDMPAVSHNLPSEPNTFVGRFQAIERLSAALSQRRLVVVQGPGGTGKTRLAVHFARQSLATYPGGVCFCDLSEAHTHEAMRRVIAQELGVTLRKEEPDEKLGYAISGRGRCLIILDNFEQLVPSSAAVVSQWVAQAEQACFLVTSRIRLGVPDEQRFFLSTMSDADAIELFVRRARARSPAFAPGEHPALPALIRQLDNLPLAIELAAARVLLLRPAQMLHRMDQRFQLLARAPANPSRFDTLRATIDWSWALLSDWEKTTFAQCSVFESGFTLKAAEAVVDLSEHPGAPWLLDVLQSLIDKSLLRPMSGNQAPSPRFGMLVSLQEYAKARLKERSDEAACFHRHTVYYDPGVNGIRLDSDAVRGDPIRLQGKRAEIDNLYAAAARAAESHPMRSARITLAVGTLAEHFRPLTASVADAQQALMRLEPLAPRDTAPLRARLLTWLGTLVSAQGRTAFALQCYNSAEQIARRVGDTQMLGHILRKVGDIYFKRGQLSEAETHFRESVTLAVEVNDVNTELYARIASSIVWFVEGKREQGMARLMDVLDVAHEAGHLFCAFQARSNLGSMLRGLGQPRQAEQHLLACMAYYRQINDRHKLIVTMQNLAGLQYEEQLETEQAFQNLEQVLWLSRRTGNRYREVKALRMLGLFKRGVGRFEDARAHYEDALRLYEGMDTPLEKARTLEKLSEISLLLQDPTTARVQCARAVETARAAGDLPDRLRLSARLGFLEAEGGHFDSAAAILHDALNDAREHNLPEAEGHILNSMGVAAALRGDISAARSLAQAGGALIREHASSPFSLGASLILHGNVALHSGDFATAHADLDEVRRLKLFEGRGMLHGGGSFEMKSMFETLEQKLITAEARQSSEKATDRPH
ncbi:MAG: tetratricopeptide repeat protein [Myxococcota bacterium]